MSAVVHEAKEIGMGRPQKYPTPELVKQFWEKGFSALEIRQRLNTRHGRAVTNEAVEQILQDAGCTKANFGILKSKKKVLRMTNRLFTTTRNPGACIYTSLRSPDSLQVHVCESRTAKVGPDIHAQYCDTHLAVIEDFLAKLGRGISFAAPSG